MYVQVGTGSSKLPLRHSPMLPLVRGDPSCQCHHPLVRDLPVPPALPAPEPGDRHLLPALMGTKSLSICIQQHYGQDVMTTCTRVVSRPPATRRTAAASWAPKTLLSSGEFPMYYH